MVERAQDVTSFFGRVISRVLSLGNFGPPGTRRTNITPLPSGSPNGQVLDNEGSIVLALNPVGLWQKTSGGYSNTGWTQVASGSTQGDLAYGLRITGVNSLSPNGSVNTSVILFNAQATPDYVSLPLADWVVQTNSPTEGTSFRITMQGKYVASLSVPTSTAAPGQNVFSAITLDATGIILNTVACAFMGFQNSIQAGSFNPDDSLPAEVPVSAPFSLTQEAIDAGRGLLRFHAIDASRAQGSHVGAVLRRIGDARQ